MSSFLLRHLLESTFFCLLLSGIAICLRRGATARYAVLLMGIGKFAIPTVVLTSTGEQMASLWPAARWLALVTYKLSVLFGAIQNAFPVRRDIEIFSVWLVGTVAMLTLWAIRWRRSRPILAAATPSEEAALRHAQQLLPVYGKVKLRRSNVEIEPALRGIFRPVVTIPQGLSDRLTPAELEGVLLHELAHVRRFDNLTGVFVHALVCLFWFHPLLWILEKRLNIERERACDETVIACGLRPQVYAAGILKVCRFQLFDTAAPGISTMSGGDLKSRLSLILDVPASASLLFVPWLLIAALTIFMTLVPVAGGYCAQCAQSSVECKAPASCAQKVIQ
jgi:beta-lactamase regulating signal transducer with metallopeptidase domain